MNLFIKNALLGIILYIILAVRCAGAIPVQNIKYKTILVQNIGNKTVSKNLLYSIAVLGYYIYSDLGVKDDIVIKFVGGMDEVAYVSYDDYKSVYIDKKYINSMRVLEIAPHELFHVWQFQNNFKGTILSIIGNDYSERRVEREAVIYTAQHYSRSLHVFLLAFDRFSMSNDYVYNTTNINKIN